MNHTIVEAAQAVLNGLMDRSELPQFGEKVTRLFVQSLRKSGVTVTEESATIGSLLPTQTTIDTDKVDSKASAWVEGEYPNLSDSILVSREGRIVDGHHRWAALKSFDPEIQVSIFRADLPIEELVNRANSFIDVTESVLACFR